MHIPNSQRPQSYGLKSSSRIPIIFRRQGAWNTPQQRFAGITKPGHYFDELDKSKQLGWPLDTDSAKEVYRKEQKEFERELHLENQQVYEQACKYLATITKF